MAINKYCNLYGQNKIKDDYTKVNDGFSQVEADVAPLVVSETHREAAETQREVNEFSRQLRYENTKHYGSYKADFLYHRNNTVSFGGSSFMLTANESVGNAPPLYPETFNAYWQLIGLKGERGEQGIQGIQGIKGQDGTGIGDMVKSVYDKDNDGIVDVSKNSDTLDGKHAAQGLNTVEKGDLAGAINEVDGKVGALLSEITTATSKLAESDIKLKNEIGTVKTNIDAHLADMSAHGLGDVQTSTLSTYNVASFPNTAKHAPIASWVAEGRTDFNLVKNGNFDNASNWIYNDGNQPIVSNNEYIFIAGQAYAGVAQKVPFRANRKYFVRVLLKTNSNQVKLFVSKSPGNDVGVINHSGSGNYEALSTIVTMPTDSSDPLVAIYDSRASGWTETRVKQAIAIDMGAETSNSYYNLTADQMNERFPQWIPNTLTSAQNADLVTCGRNLFDKATAIMDGFRVNETNGETFKDVNGDGHSAHIPVKPHTTYSVSGWNPSSIMPNAGYSVSKTYTQGLVIYYHAGMRNFTTGADTYYVKISLFNEYLNTIMLNEGSAAFPYEPYDETRVNIPPLNAWDKIENGKLTVGSEKVVLNGSESWALYSTKTNCIQFVMNPCTLNSVAINSNSPSDYGSKYISNLNYINNGTDDKVGIQVHQANGVNWVVISIQKTVLSTQDVTGFKSWLASNNVTVVYQLAKPSLNQLPIANLDSFTSGQFSINNAVEFEAKPNASGVLTIPYTDRPISSINSVIKFAYTYGELVEEIIYGATKLSDTTIQLPSGFDTTKMYQVKYSQRDYLPPLVTLKYGNNTGATIDNLVTRLANTDKFVMDLNDFTVAMLLNHEARLTAHNI